MPEAGLDVTRTAAGSSRSVLSPFVFPVRVYYEDTDAGGIVYHANYLKFAERARTEMLRAAGIDQSDMRDRHGLGFVVRRCTVDYLAPARLDDRLDVSCDLRAVRGAAIEIFQEVGKAGDAGPLVTLDLVVALVDAEGRPRRLPRDIRDRLAGTAGMAAETDKF
ncbi:MAG: tol-pal system-associated acyl-CoA thioesterase [Alphaproteobacteria bacterium]|nr:tol-pal system-associated acyl-CoA thioesterase [Alphaproteobacteria bacterium]